MHAKNLRVMVVAIAAVVALASVASDAWASTIKLNPSAVPFVVPGDSAGNPTASTVTASGFTPGAQVFVEQCDGVDPSTFGWSPTADCDLGTSPSPATAEQYGHGDVRVDQRELRVHAVQGSEPAVVVQLLVGERPGAQQRVAQLPQLHSCGSRPTTPRPPTTSRSCRCNSRTRLRASRSGRRRFLTRRSAPATPRRWALRTAQRA